MSPTNVDTIRSVHESWNRRDFEQVVRNMGDHSLYIDHARNLRLNKGQFLAWARAWTTAFSDARIVSAQYSDGGNFVVAQYTVEGTNDGAFMDMPATGRRVSFSFCGVTRFDGNGTVTTGNSYYDLYTILVQLGHIDILPRAA